MKTIDLILRCMFSVVALCLFSVFVVPAVWAADTVSMNRLYNPNSGEHFYTSDDSERDYLVSLGWSSEGVGWVAPGTSSTPVYRVYNAAGGEHHYTMNASERDSLVSLGWNDEGVGWYSDDAQTVPLFRDYNPNAFANNHNYTVDASEHEFLVSLGWHDEGTAWYGVASSNYSQSGQEYSQSGQEYSQSGQEYSQSGQENSSDSQSHEPLRFTDNDGDEVTVDTNSNLNLFVNNKIASATVSNPSALVENSRLVGSNDRGRYFVTRDAGKAVVTITDVYGQSISRTVNVVYTGYNLNLTSSKANSSLAKPTISRTSFSDATISAVCPNAVKGTDNLVYEIWACKSGDFDSEIYSGTENISADTALGDPVEVSAWNYNKAYTSYVSIPSGDYYVRVRLRVNNSNSYEYGPWSDTVKVVKPVFSNKGAGKANYSYEVYGVAKAGQTAYTGLKYPVYVRTSNPMSAAFEVYDVTDGEEKNAAYTHYVGSGGRFADISYSDNSDENEQFRRVSGGYIALLTLDNAGKRTLEIREGQADGYVIAKTFTVNVVDSSQALADWQDGIISKCTTSTMNAKEKMDAVVSYIWKNEGFKYLTNQGGSLVSLAKDPNSPYCVMKHWDSYVSPAALCSLAERINATCPESKRFSEIHNCYGDYPIGSSGWQAMHYYCRVTYQGEEYHYEACPSTSTGEVGDYPMVDFSIGSPDLYALN